MKFRSICSLACSFLSISHFISQTSWAGKFDHLTPTETCAQDIDGYLAPFPLTKVTASIGKYEPGQGPGSTAAELEAMVREGAGSVRANMSHILTEDDYANLGKTLQLADAIQVKTGTAFGKFGDLGGPKIRLAKIGDVAPGKELDLRVGQRIAMYDELKSRPEGFEIALPIDKEVAEKVIGALKVQVQNQGLHPNFSCNDDNVHFQVVQVLPSGALEVAVTQPGKVSARKGLNFSETEFADIPALTAKDIRDIGFLLPFRPTAIALSFAQSAEDIYELRRVIENQLRDLNINNYFPLIIIKIETKAGALNLQAMLDTGIPDVVMVARGDLKPEVRDLKMAAIGSHIAVITNQNGKPVIMATEYLENRAPGGVISRPQLDGMFLAGVFAGGSTMLSGDAHADNVATMIRLHRANLPTLIARRYYRDARSETRNIPLVAAGEEHLASIVEHATERDVEAIVAFDLSESEIRTLLKFRPTVPVVVVSNDRVYLERLSFYGPVQRIWLRDREFTAANAFAAAQALLFERGIGADRSVIQLQGVHDTRTTHLSRMLDNFPSNN